MGARIIVVEDEDAILVPLAGALTAAGYQTLALHDGTAFEEELDAFRPDLVILDLMLPVRDGMSLAAAVRGRSDSGVLILTARDTVADRVRGLQGGADDYMVKPFATEELLARVAAILRRLGRLPSRIQVGDLLLDEEAGMVLQAGRPVSLTATEFKLLAYLIVHRGRTLSKTRLLTQVWGYDEYDPNLVEVHISTLRRKLERDGPRLIHTLRGLGYVLRP